MAELVQPPERRKLSAEIDSSLESPTRTRVLTN